ncbi:MAG: helix-turn-helix transcriptional regulator [Clostridiales bacterium]|nr:helix-turn-helix transcriptional regulator [Clostridiales bacterium]
MGSGDFTFLKGNIETIILCSLYKEDKYGYEIAKEIKNRTSNRYQIKNATLYSYLKRLEDDHLIASYWGETSNGGRRRYYSLTNIGRANCQQFISEWEYQRGVMSDLVDGTADGVEISQDEATPLFGRRSQRRTRKNEYRSQLDEQDEIARRLRELSGDDTPAEENLSKEDSSFAEDIVETEVLTHSEPEIEIVEQEPSDESTTPTYAEEPSVVATVPPTVEPHEDAKTKFDVNQDSAEDFLQQFEQRAREAERQTPSSPTSEGENYQHVLMNVLGDQLDGMPSHNTESDNLATIYYEDHPAALEDVADSLAREGIRIRIYNHATAAYKPKILIPQSKVLCQTAWFTYAFAFLYFGIFALASITVETPLDVLSPWKAFLITLAALIVIPLGFSIYAILYPTRKDKPKFNFRIAIIVASVICAIIVLAAVGFSALGNMEFADYSPVSKQILIPLGIALLFPVFIGIYELLYKQY